MKAIRSMLATAWFGVLAASGGGGDSAPPVGPPAPPGPPAAPPHLTLTLADTLGRFVDGATITVASTGVAGASDASGKATLKVPVGSEQVLAIARSGFAEQVRVVRLAATATEGSAVALLVPREPAATIPAIEAGGSATGKHGVKVEFPADALVDANGQPVTGTIDLFMTPLDVSSSDVGAFPGLFEGIPTGAARSLIVSLGASELVPQQGGQKLRLAAGKTATIELPIYARTLFDGTAIEAGATIPFWSLASATGLWTQEGNATVVASAASPTGLALRATIGHFSWWNVDQAAPATLVNLTVNAIGLTVPAGTTTLVQAQVVAGTGPTSVGTTGFTVGVAQAERVPALAAIRFSTSFAVGDRTCSGSATVNVVAGATVDVPLNAVCVQLPTPTIVAPAGLSSTNSSAPTHVQIVVDGSQPDSVELLVDGTVVQTFGPQFFYVHLLDTAGFPEGTVFLQARATLSGVQSSGNSVTLVIDRTAPQATQISPPPGSQVSRDTTFAVTFDEPVNPLPFALADAVKLSVTPPGAATPVVLPADIVLDTSGLTLTVTLPPGTALPLGTAGLTWGGLGDAAGNAIAGTVAATWEVDRSELVGPPLSHLSGAADFIGAALAIGADGSLLVAHKPAPGDFISLSRYDPASGTWVVVVPAVNERPTQSMLQLAIDGSGLPYVAFVQQTAADPGAFELVLKRLVGGTTLEPAAPAVALPGTRGIDVSSGSMAIDASNRPVITFTDPNVSNVRLFRLEAGALVSQAPVATLAFDPDLALQADGTILVGFIQGFAGSNAGALRVASVVNGNVQLLGPVIDSAPNATQSIAQPRVVARGNEPWVFWNKFDGASRRAHAARFDGTSWIETTLPAPIDAFELDAAVLDGDPILAASQSNGQTQVLRLRNGAWEAGVDATPLAGPGDRMQLVVRGTTTALISSNRSNPIAEVQRLQLP
jgi:hypothetical protein